MRVDDSRFVYIYLSSAGAKEVPVYVGRGTATRVVEHGIDDPNAELASIIESGEYAVEVLDCGDPATAVVVEGALISAMLGRSKINLKNGRRDQFNFSPLGVPLSLASRRGERALTPAEIAAQLKGNVLFVRIGAKELNDPARGVIDPGNPSPDAVADRLKQWWYIESWVGLWEKHPEQAPIALVGVAGSKHRYIIGAIDVKSFDWGTLEWDGKAVSFPIAAEDASIDGFDLRGRTIREGAIFGRSQWQFARLYDQNGPISRPAP